METSVEKEVTSRLDDVGVGDRFPTWLSIDTDEPVNDQPIMFIRALEEGEEYDHEHGFIHPLHIEYGFYVGEGCVDTMFGSFPKISHWFPMIRLALDA